MKIFKMEEKPTESLAEALGASAFREGRMRIPAHDARLVSAIPNIFIGENIRFLAAWLRGWDAENLKGHTNE